MSRPVSPASPARSGPSATASGPAADRAARLQNGQRHGSRQRPGRPARALVAARRLPARSYWPARRSDAVLCRRSPMARGGRAVRAWLTSRGHGADHGHGGRTGTALWQEPGPGSCLRPPGAAAGLAGRSGGGPAAGHRPGVPAGNLNGRPRMAPEGKDARDPMDAIMAEVAQETGGTGQAYPRPGRAVRRVVLRDSHSDRRLPVRGGPGRRRRDTADNTS
jgi:hypothetical protein